MGVNLAQLIGARVREMREEAQTSRDALVRVCHRLGVTEWHTSRIAQVEEGAFTPSIDTVIVLAQALASIRSEPVTLADLIPGAVEVEVGRELVIPAADIRAAVSGSVITPTSRASSAPVPSGFRGVQADPHLAPGWGNADDKAADALEAVHGAGPATILDLAERLWGEGATVTTERDRRAGPDATKQKKGRITRTLIDELLAEYEDGSGRAAYEAD